MVDLSQPDNKELIYTFVSLLIVFIMIFSYDIHIDKNLRKSRGFIAYNFIILIAVLFFVFGICFFLKKKNIIDFGLDDNPVIGFTNIFRIVGFFFGITSFALPILSVTNYNIKPKEQVKIDIAKITVYSFFIMVFYAYEFFKGDSNNNLRDDRYLIYLSILFAVCCIYIGLILGLKNNKNKYQYFYSKDNYGSLCIAENFKDVSLDPLICPTNKLN